MSSVMLFLSGDAALLALAVLATGVARKSYAPLLIYGCALAISAVMLIGAIVQLLGGITGGGIVLPLGLPWIGARFLVDPLSAFFLVIVNLGAAAACLYGLGQGRSERSPERVLPFFPAFLAGMNLVLVADDAYTFLLSWEFMSLASWALVMAHHREADNARAGYVYLVMASFGTLALLLAFAFSRAPPGATPSNTCARRRRRPASPASPSCWRSSAPGRRLGLCRCTFGFRSPTPRRRATSPR